MLDLYQTPLDFLYLSLTICVGLLSLFIILALYNVIRILYNVRSVSEKVQETVDLINHYLWQPIRFIMEMMEKGKERVRKKGGVSRDERRETS